MLRCFKLIVPVSSLCVSPFICFCNKQPKLKQFQRNPCFLEKSLQASKRFGLKAYRQEQFLFFFQDQKKCFFCFLLFFFFLHCPGSKTFFSPPDMLCLLWVVHSRRPRKALDEAPGCRFVTCTAVVFFFFFGVYIIEVYIRW